MSNKTFSNKDQEIYATESDLLSNLRLACQFADLAQQHYDIFDDSGFNYCVEQHLTHARAVSRCFDKLKKKTMK